MIMSANPYAAPKALAARPQRLRRRQQQLGPAALPREDESLEGLGRQWPAAVETLILVASQPAQELQLGLGLHAFGDHLEPELMGYGDDGAYDCRVAGVNRDVTNERAINLQRLDGEALEIAQAGVAG